MGQNKKDKLSRAETKRFKKTKKRTAKMGNPPEEVEEEK